MPFQTATPPPRRIAVIGGGISGMAAAHLLAADHAVVLYEAEARLGGHARTVLAGKRGDQPVDTGFIVFNKVNYPHLLDLFKRLAVPLAPSQMSFGASIRGGWLEYALTTLDQIFTQRANLASPGFLRMLRDILHFHKHAGTRVRPGMSMGDLLATLGTGQWFRDFYILPMSGAIWSTPSLGVLDFPAETLVRFFHNHALMSASGQHPWFTVQGGSVQYVSRLQAAMTRQGVDIRTGTGVAGVRRGPAGVIVRAFGAEWEHFDEGSLPAIPTTACAFWPIRPRLSGPRCPPCAISPIRPCCMPTPARCRATARPGPHGSIPKPPARGQTAST